MNFIVHYIKAITRHAKYGYGTIGTFFVCFSFSLLPVFAFDNNEIIDITGLNYGRLQLAIEVEKSSRRDEEKLKQFVGLIKKNLMWSGLFDLHKSTDNIDLVLKIGYRPRHEIKARIYSQDGNLLYSGGRSLNNNHAETVVLELVEELIFQLTGETSILRSAIVFVERDRRRKYRLILSDTFGKSTTVFLGETELSILPRWSPNASSVLFTSLGENGSRIKQLLLKTREVKTLFKNMGKLSGGTWGPNGKELIITLAEKGNSDLFKINMFGKVLEQLTFRSSSESNPRWSPDGKRLLFVSNRSGSVQIYQRVLHSRETFRMTFEGGYNVEPNWSNDGSYIVFSGRIFSRKKNKTVPQVFLMDKEGEFVQQVTNEDFSAEQPVWAPNGRQILYVASVGFDQKLFIIRADGTFKRRLTDSPEGISEFNPTWTSDYLWQPGRK
ncbi:MAG: hypothetical protein GY866_12270 [Proteobacteria bacterium]|nr:hypothetical protein [Pseudomonadota bacterium]